MKTFFKENNTLNSAVYFRDCREGDHTRCLVDEERDVGVVAKDEVVQHLGSTEVSHTIFVTLILIVTSS